MRRRDVLSLFAATMLLAAGGFAREARAQQQQADDAQQRPNVLFIAVDDLRPELGAYGEATGQGWISKEHEPLKVFRNDAWNKYRIRALGDSITAWVNGTRVAGIRDTASNQSGHLGLQVHAVPGDARWQVRWRNLRIRELETAYQ